MSLNTGNAILSNAITVDGSYNVGIGNTTPLATLDVYKSSVGTYFRGGSDNVARQLKFTSSTTTNAGDTHTIDAQSGTGVLQLAVTSSPKLTILASGNVGIATSSPSYTFQVAKNTNDWIGGFKNYGADAYGLNIDLSGSTGLTTTYALGVYTQLSTGFFVRNNGYVGVGTTTPNQIFTIKAAGGNNGLIAFQSAAGANTAYFGIPNANGDVVTTSTTADLCVRGETGNILFSFSNQERMRIFTNGTVMIGTSNTSGQALWINTTTGGSTGQGGMSLQGDNMDTGHANGTASGSFYQRFIYNGQVIGSITQNGTTNTAFNTSSDYRLKEDFKEIYGLDKVSAIKVYDFKWKGTEERMDGVIAHELAEVLPYAVSGEKDALDKEGNINPQGVDYSKIVPILVKAIQEQQAMIEAQQQQINQLINK